MHHRWGGAVGAVGAVSAVGAVGFNGGQDACVNLLLLQSSFRPEKIIMAEGLDLDNKFQALEEFVVETLSDFNKRLQNIETGIRETITDELSDFKVNTSSEIKESVSMTIQTEIDKLKEDFNDKIPQDLLEFKHDVSMEIQETVHTEIIKAKEEMQQKMDDEPCVEKGQKTFNPIMFQYMNEPKSSTPKKAIIPTKICDLQNEALQSALASFETSVKYNKEKNKMRPVQLYYVHYWLSKNKGATGKIFFFFFFSFIFIYQYLSFVVIVMVHINELLCYLQCEVSGDNIIIFTSENALY